MDCKVNVIDIFLSLTHTTKSQCTYDELGGTCMMRVSASLDVLCFCRSGMGGPSCLDLLVVQNGVPHTFHFFKLSSDGAVLEFCSCFLVANQLKHVIIKEFHCAFCLKFETCKITSFLKWPYLYVNTKVFVSVQVNLSLA